jgi:hypothetical protein
MIITQPSSLSFRRAATLLTLAASFACVGDPGRGVVEFRIWGEDFIEEGIPADEFADGWAVEFDRFEVQIRDISIAETPMTDTSPFDISEPSDGEGQLIGLLGVPAGDHADATYTLAWTIVEGRAHKDGVDKTFVWEFEQPVRYTNCEAVTRVEAVTGYEGGPLAVFEITVHADHLFYDSLVAEDPDLRFAALAAADSDDDGVITQAELAAADLGAYDPGNLAIDDLWSFLVAQAQTMGHVNGEGHCDSTPV